MNELDDELIDVNAFKEAVSKLANLETIKKIKTIVADRVDGEIYICSTKSKNQLYEIHFLVDTTRQLSLFDLAELMSSFSKLIGYDEIIVQPKSFHKGKLLDENFKQVVAYSVDNIANIQNFLKNIFPNINSNELVDTANTTNTKSYVANNKWGFLQSSNTINKNSNSTTEPNLEKSGKETFEKYFSTDEPISEAGVIDFLKGFIKTAKSCGLDSKNILNAISPSINRHQPSK